MYFSVVQFHYTLNICVGETSLANSFGVCLVARLCLRKATARRVVICAARLESASKVRDYLSKYDCFLWTISINQTVNVLVVYQLKLIHFI